MKPVLLLACLLTTSPAFAQTKVYTNADLGRPLSHAGVRVSAEQLASLAAHQFRIPVFPDGPRVVLVSSSPTSGPFGDFQNTILPRRLDGSLWTEPQWQVSYSPGFYPYAVTGGSSARLHRQPGSARATRDTTRGSRR